MNPDTYKRRVVERLDALQISAAELARRAGVDAHVVKDISRPRVRWPRGDNLVLLAMALKCSPAWLLGATDVLDEDVPLRRSDQPRRVQATGLELHRHPDTGALLSMTDPEGTTEYILEPPQISFLVHLGEEALADMKLTASLASS